MRRIVLLVSVLVAVGGCRSGIDCGAYVFDDVTQTCRCPAGTVELPAGGGCVEGDAGGVDAGADAGAHDAMTDTPEHDGGPSCTAEACNGEDDDCDGLIDEGVLTVGPAVEISTAPEFRGGLMAPVSGGFGVLAHTAASPSVFSRFDLDAAGLVRGTSGPLGSDTDQEMLFFFDVASADDVLLTIYTPDLDGALGLLGFDVHTGARTTGAAPVPVAPSSGRMYAVLPRITALDGERATVYLTERTGTEVFVRRLRIDLTETPPSVISSIDVAAGTLTNALGSAVADYLVIVNGAEPGPRLWVGPPGDTGGSFRDLGDVPFAGAMAIADPSRPVSAANPLALAAQGTQPVRAAFVEVTNATVLAVGPVLEFADSVGAYRDLASPHLVDVISLPRRGGDRSHWVVATVDNQDGTSSGDIAAVLQLHEIVDGGSTIRSISIADEASRHLGDIRLARSDGSTRVLESANLGGLATRSIGCE